MAHTVDSFEVLIERTALSCEANVSVTRTKFQKKNNEYGCTARRPKCLKIEDYKPVLDRFHNSGR